MPMPVHSADTLTNAQQLIEQLQAELKFKQARIDALNFELARLKHWRFGSSSESLHSTQGQLFDAKTGQLLDEETRWEDTAADKAHQSLQAPAKQQLKQQPKRQKLPSQLERIEHHHELPSTQCACGHALQRIGQEISEQLDCVPAQFFVHRHIRGKYACAHCKSLQTAAMPAQIIDKGIAAPGLLAQVIVAKHDDHLPLYRQEEIYRRSGAHISRSSMASWIGHCGVQLEPLVQALREHLLGQSVLHVDETPVELLAPGKGQTHKAYTWVYRSGAFHSEPAVVFDFCLSRAGQHARDMLGHYEGTLVVDDFSGYKALFQDRRIQEAGCWAHARRKFFEAHKLNNSAIAHQALHSIGQLYDIERQCQAHNSDERFKQRQALSQPLLSKFNTWLQEQRGKLASSDVTAKAIDYTLHRWAALTLHLRNGHVPVGRVEMWRGGRRSGLSVAAPFVWRCPSNLRRSSVSTSPSSNRTCRSPASGSLATH